MKTYHIKDLLKKELLILELSDECEIIPHDNGIIVVKDSVVQWEIKGSYTLLGKLDEIKEEDAKELVETGLFITQYDSKYYWIIENYNTDFTDISEWEEISEELYYALLKHNK